jgi:NAD(P)-dependent dehydrogenase (short-subunit alcohol dehydrogenase family)
MMDWNLQGKVALVTGGVNGIGRAIALALLATGCKVCIADLRVEAAKDSKEFDTENAHLRALDVGDAEAVQHTVYETIRDFGRIDILVNSAGILKTGPVTDASYKDWDDVQRVNLAGVYYCSKAVIPGMIAAKQGRIINIASVSSVKGGGAFGNVLYGTSKAGVVAMTQGCARELAPYGVNVNAISPGVVDTPMTSGLMTPEVRARIIDGIPMKRLIQPSEVAGLAVFLASDLANSITGQVIAIDGGFLVR